MNRKAFFEAVRRTAFTGTLSQSQVDGLNLLLDVWLSHFGKHDPRWLAYCLATARHETAGTMLPVKEYGSDTRANRLYGVEGRFPERARRMGNTERGDGARYKGRGFVQLTWKNNYRKAGEALGIDLVGDPDAALVPDIAAKILFRGCIEGWFTGMRLSDFVNSDEQNYLLARQVVNGRDRATMIAEYAADFEAALCSSSTKCRGNSTSLSSPILSQIISLWTLVRMKLKPTFELFGKEKP